jgi:hypothetical protein
MLDWIKNPDLRRRAHLGLNKGEARKRWPVPSISVGSARSATAALRTSSSAPPGSTCWSRPSSFGTRSTWRWPTRAAAPGRDDQRGLVAACSAARLGTHRADRRLRLEHCRSAPAFGLTATTIAYHYLASAGRMPTYWTCSVGAFRRRSPIPSPLFQRVHFLSSSRATAAIVAFLRQPVRRPAGLPDRPIRST